MLFIDSHLFCLLFERDLRQPMHTFGETEAKQFLMQTTPEYCIAITPDY